MRTISKLGALSLGFALAIPAHRLVADGPDRAELKATLANAAIPADERARRALEGATAIDESAQRTASSAGRRRLWGEAVGLVDDFLAANPGVEAAPLLRFQAGVYRWAEARSLADQADQGPGGPSAKAAAIRALDDAIGRFRAVAPKSNDPAEPLAQNARFRLAQAIADRSRLLPDDDPGRLAGNREALGLLDGSLTSPGILPFARLLRADLSIRLGSFGQAQMEIEEAEKLKPPPPPVTLLELKVATLIGREMFGQARTLVDSSGADDGLKRLLELRITLGRRKGLPPGRERKELDAEAFGLAGRLASMAGAESRRGLMELARAVDEPAGDAPPEWWDLLAEGHLRIGDPTRAGRLDARGADRADALGQSGPAASLRYKSGACLFEAEKFADADRALGRVVDEPKAPRELRARAGMLRALARGRALATRQSGASRAAYVESLEGQVRDFPDDPPTAEARWLLGQVRIASGRPAEAVTLMAKIPHGHPRWLDARLASADLLREVVEDQRINRDATATRARVEEARRSLRAATEAASEGPETVALRLRQVRLELIPGAGSPAEAVDAADRLLRMAADPDQHRLARLYRSVALAQAGRTLDAEQVARAEVRSTPPALLLPALGPLDESAAEAESEADRRRLGKILRTYTARLVEAIDQVPPAGRDEVRLRHARALLFAGDPGAARREVVAWGGPRESVGPALLRDLADLYLRLDIFALAIDAERLRADRLAPGSPPWFEARYGLALAYYRSDQAREARKVIDGTSILHSDLGGGELRVRFERLRQKLGNDR